MSATPKRTTVRKTYRIEWVKRWSGCTGRCGRQWQSSRGGAVVRGGAADVDPRLGSA